MTYLKLKTYELLSISSWSSAFFHFFPLFELTWAQSDQPDKKKKTRELFVLCMPVSAHLNDQHHRTWYKGPRDKLAMTVNTIKWVEIFCFNSRFKTFECVFGIESVSIGVVGAISIKINSKISFNSNDNCSFGRFVNHCIIFIWWSDGSIVFNELTGRTLNFNKLSIYLQLHNITDSREWIEKKNILFFFPFFKLNL